jgi:hypothetical protein
MLIQPFHLISSRESEIFRFLLDELLNILLLLCNPWRRADSSSLSRLHCRHRDVNNAASLAGRESRSIGPQCTLIVELMHRRGLLMEVSIRGWQRSKSWVGVVYMEGVGRHCFGLNRAKLPRSGDGRNYFGANPLTKAELQTLPIRESVHDSTVRWPRRS